MPESFKRVLFTNQSPNLLYRDIARALLAAGIPVRQVVAPTGWELSDQTVPIVHGRRRDTRSGLRRLWTWGSFSLSALWAMIHHRDEFGLLTTNPPFVPWLAPLARKLCGFRYAVIMYDLYPDVLVALGLLRSGGLMHRLLRWLNAVSLRNADAIIAIGRDMRRTTAAYLPAGHPVEVQVVNNWVDTDEIRPLAKAENPFAIEHGLVGKLVVMYSGNWSPTHGLDLVVELADELRGRDDLIFMLIGDGGCRAEIEADVQRRHLPNLRTLPYQPREVFRYSIAAADCQIVSLDQAFFGISTPSKTYAALAAGCAVLAITPQGTELEAIVQEHDCGVRIPSRDLAALRQAVLAYCQDPALLARHQANARRAAEECGSAAVGTARYLEILRPHVTVKDRP